MQKQTALRVMIVRLILSSIFFCSTSNAMSGEKILNDIEGTQLTDQRSHEGRYRRRIRSAPCLLEFAFLQQQIGKAPKFLGVDKAPIEKVQQNKNSADDPCDADDEDTKSSSTSSADSSSSSSSTMTALMIISSTGETDDEADDDDFDNDDDYYATQLTKEDVGNIAVTIALKDSDEAVINLAETQQNEEKKSEKPNKSKSARRKIKRLVKPWTWGK